LGWCSRRFGYWDWILDEINCTPICEFKKIRRKKRQKKKRNAARTTTKGVETKLDPIGTIL
jgi:hypothetical protein